MRLVPISELVAAVSSWDPVVSAPTKSFTYIDVSSVSQNTKTIVGPREICGADAPSRARQLVKADDVLVSTVRPNLNGVALVPMQLHGATASTGFCVLRSDPRKLCSRYLFHWVKHPSFFREMERRATGASYPAVSDRIVKESRIPLPSLSEQQRIASILDKADVVRRKRQESLVLIDELILSAFLDKFGDPVTNPKRWPTSTVGEQLEFHQYGPRFYNEVYSEDGVRIVRITDLDEEQGLDFTQMPKLAVSEADLSRYALRPGDLIFARTGATVGKVALVPRDAPVCIAGAYFITMRFKSNIHPHYALGFFRAPSIRSIVCARSRQSAQQNFSGPAIRALLMPVPPRSLQEHFAESMQSVATIRTKMERAVDDGNALFRSIESRAFKGQL
jgi:type I restriction enzyme S subunit